MKCKECGADDVHIEDYYEVLGTFTLHCHCDECLTDYEDDRDDLYICEDCGMLDFKSNQVTGHDGNGLGMCDGCHQKFMDGMPF